MIKKQFHIIRILSDTRFIIDAGKKDGIKKNNTFSIIDSEGEEIKDLKGNIIGHLGETKGKIIAKEVYDSFTVAQTKFVENAFRVNTPFSALRTAEPAHYERLNIDTKEIEPLGNENPIKKGDVVKLEE